MRPINALHRLLMRHTDIQDLADFRQRINMICALSTCIERAGEQLAECHRLRNAGEYELSRKPQDKWRRACDQIIELQELVTEYIRLPAAA